MAKKKYRLEKKGEPKKKIEGTKKSEVKDIPIMGSTTTIATQLIVNKDKKGK
jgi:hypothetical protein